MWKTSTELINIRNRIMTEKASLKKKHREFKIIQANKKYFDTVKVESINTRLKYHHHFPKTAFCENGKKKKKSITFKNSVRGNKINSKTEGQT